MAAPNPIERYTDSRLGELPKVFIVYPHNPQEYKWVRPLQAFQQQFPQHSEQQLKRIQKEEQQRLKAEEKQRISYHNNLVRVFAEFLNSIKIAVAYEGCLLDQHVDSYMRWFREEMNTSDYIILIITESFCPFLSKKPPPEEMIFQGNFLDNYVNDPPKPLLPVFLNRRKDTALLPFALKMSSSYHVVYNRDKPHFHVNQPELDRLCALLTRQDRVALPTPPASAVPVLSGLQRRRGGQRAAAATATPQPLGPRHQQMYAYLVAMRRPLTNDEEINLSEKQGFSAHWRLLAQEFGFGPAEIERVMAVDHYDSERCIQFLLTWRQREAFGATVARLAEGICRIQNNVMLEILHSVLK